LRPRFVITGQLGEGSQGVIFSVTDQDCRREVALKTLHEAKSDITEISRFIHEAQITAQLEHPGIVPVHDFEGAARRHGVLHHEAGGRRVAGGASQAARRRAEHRFDLLQLFVRVCEAVGFSHSRGVIHRDLKPRNVMVAATARCW